MNSNLNRVGSPPSQLNGDSTRFLNEQELRAWYAAIREAREPTYKRRLTWESWCLESQRSNLCAKHR